MHELGIIVHITKTLQNVAKENNLKRNRLCHSGNRGSEHNRP